MKNEEILTHQNKILNALTEGRGFQGIAKELGHSLKRPVLIMNAAFRVIGTYSQVEISVGNLLKIKFTGDTSVPCAIVLEKKGEIPSYFQRITGQNHRFQGFLSIFQITELSEEEKSLIAQAALLCALEFAKDDSILKAQREYKDAFIYDLIYSNFDSVKDILSRGEIWGWNLNQPHVVFVFEVEEYQDFTSDRHLMEVIYQIVETELEKITENPILMKKQGQLISIVPVEKNLSSKENKTLIKKWAEKILSAVSVRVNNRKIGIGIGRTYSSPNDIFRSFQESKVALELGWLMGEQSQIYFFKDLGLVRILYHHDQQELREFYNETLGELDRPDHEQGKELMKTLEEFIQHQFDLKSTAQSLFLHPNTLRYRLKKIEDILEVNLDALDTRFDLVTAFKIKSLKKV